MPTKKTTKAVKKNERDDDQGILMFTDAERKEIDARKKKIRAEVAKKKGNGSKGR